VKEFLIFPDPCYFPYLLLFTIFADFIGKVIDQRLQIGLYFRLYNRRSDDKKNRWLIRNHHRFLYPEIWLAN